MLASILVATPHAAFGELLRISLEDSGQYQVRLVMSAREARASAARSSFQLAILDAALTDEVFASLCTDILEMQKGIRLIVVPPDNNPNHPSLGGLLPHGYLSRPFYLPDLIETVTRLLNQRRSELHEQKKSSVTLPPWLTEPPVLQKYLEKELPGTQALAAIVGQHGPALGSGSITAFSGQLEDSSAQELANMVFRYWNHDENTDLMRFVRLASNKKDLLIYAARIAGELVLILAYDTTAPLSQIRPQTKALAQALASQPPDNDIPSSKHPTPEASADSLRSPAASLIQDGRFPAHRGQPPAEDEPTQPDILQSLRLFEPPDEETEPPSLPAVTAGENPLLDDFDFLSRLPNTSVSDTQGQNRAEDAAQPDSQINLPALLGLIPPPDPGQEPAGGGMPLEESAPFPSPIQPGPLSGWKVYGEPDTNPAAAEENQPETVPLQPAPVQAAPAKPAEHRPGSIMPAFDLNLAVEEEIDSLEDTRPHIVAALTSLSQLEPPSPALSQLNYTCVLIPRLPQHYLTGELADRLAYWVQQLCLAFGWRLEGIAIRPEYLQWTVQVSPSISPGNLVRIVRQRTSLQIFNQFSHFSEQNPSGDFWAAGYLIVSGSQPPSAQLLRDYIAQTRKRQGVLK